LDNSVTVLGTSEYVPMLQALATEAINGRSGVLLFGESGVGKTNLVRAWEKIAPGGSEVILVNCAEEKLNGDMDPLFNKLARIITDGKNKGIWIIALDEVDAVAQSRGEPAYTRCYTQQVMGLLDLAHRRGEALVVLCTNVPNRIDSAVIGRCKDAIFVDLPGKTFIEDALVREGYDRSKAIEASLVWEDRMATRGYPKPQEILEVTQRETKQVMHLAPAELVDYIEPLVREPRVRNRRQYENDHTEWLNMAQETMGYYGHTQESHISISPT